MLGACIESETTAATLGQQGVRKHNPYANLDFMSVPLPTYVNSHIQMANRLKWIPRVFLTNYFLKNEEGQFLNHKLDKLAWIHWAEGRVHREYQAITTPVGFLPLYEDLAKIFVDKLGREYKESDYIEQFSLRTDAYIAKYKRMKAAFKGIRMPEPFIYQLRSQITRLQAAKQRFGDVITPEVLKNANF